MAVGWSPGIICVQGRAVIWKMEVYNMDGHISYFAGIESCDMAIHNMIKLPSPWKDIMDIKKLGNKKSFVFILTFHGIL